MDINTFLILLALKWQWYLLALVISIVLLFPVARCYGKGLYDSFFYSVFFSMMANAVPIFLYFIDTIPTKTFVYFLCSESAFWIGLSLFAKKKFEFSSWTLKLDDDVTFHLYCVLFSLFLFFTLLVYYMLGIPLFFEEGRLTLFSGSGGLGVLQRITDFQAIFIAFYSFCLLDKKKHITLARAGIAIVSLTYILSGSKFAVLNVVFAYFGYRLFIKKSLPSSLKLLPFLIGGIVVAALILVVQVRAAGGDLVSGFLNLFIRFIAAGDCYSYGYPNDVIDHVDTGNWFTFLFQGFLSPSRIIDPSLNKPAAGVQMIWTVYPQMIGDISGPNTRIPILSYILFHWWGIPFACVVGMLTSIALFRSCKLFSNDIVGKAFFTYVYATLNYAITDFTLAIGSLFNILLNLIILAVILTFLLWVHKRLNVNPASNVVVE